ncbi:MAG: glycogen/starch/alpha-glucan phosphorylase [Thermoanaerobaculales bacterium]|nr:glycogen/starch/alpha-glucan phosphorylase [Thermoanaerobaculales bacterium]
MTPNPSPAQATPEDFRERFLTALRYSRGVEMYQARPQDHLAALKLAVREYLVDRAVQTSAAYRKTNPKTVHYLSLEFLLGRLLRNNLIATGLLPIAREAMASLDLDLDSIVDEEADPGLGNGGLGRLAACFLDSLATLDYPSFGYGLHYDYGMFRQRFEDGWQVEYPDNWLEGGYPWELTRHDRIVQVKIGGRVEWIQGTSGKHRPKWVGWRTIHGVPQDIMVAGYGTQTVSILRLWSAQASKEFDFHIFSQGDYLRAVEGREHDEAITKVLYPADDTAAGRRLRLVQEYFLVACSVRDVVSRFQRSHGDDWTLFPDQVALQLNDTHPALAVAELMRFLIDEAGLKWVKAWDITRKVCSYTNHTLLPEAMETWPVRLMEKVIPRHLQIIYEINRRFIESMRERFDTDTQRLQRMSILEDGGSNRIRMANLAIVGSHKVNGVAKLHTELLKKRVVRDFAEVWPERFLAITNGVTPRRWLLSCNPRLAEAITKRIGKAWVRDLDRLADLGSFADDPDFQDEFLEIKRANKEDLATVLENLCGLRPKTESLFDVQIKRLHEYKRQLLNLMHVIWMYHRIKEDPTVDLVPRTFIFGAKAAPAYNMAKLIIRAIHGVAEVVNNDSDVEGRIQILFPPDYRVTLAEQIIPAADLSEQISTAGMEASGTGNMKLALNGALTIGTLDGANIEIRDAVGNENIFIFGLTADEVEDLRTTGAYQPWEIYRRDPELAQVIDSLHDGRFAGSDADALREIWSALMDHGDHYLHLADFHSYLEAQRKVDELYKEPRKWAAAAIRNVAAMGYFSSDRAITQYAQEIWKLEPVEIEGDSA